MQKTFASYLGIDFSPDMLAIAKQKFGNQKHIEFREGDITAMKGKKEIKKYAFGLATFVVISKQ